MVALVPEKQGPWIFTDLQQLPETHLRYEILDGSLLMSPAPNLRHEFVLARLRTIIGRAIGDEVVAFANITIDLDPSFFIPDLTLAAVSDVDPAADKLAPEHALLVVEAVSKSSRSADRILKPALYTAAGIPAYWRIESEGRISLTAYALRTGRYEELGTWTEGETARISEPFEIEIPINDLVP